MEELAVVAPLAGQGSPRRTTTAIFMAFRAKIKQFDPDRTGPASGEMATLSGEH
jgi:hypothetical protein